MTVIEPLGMTHSSMVWRDEYETIKEMLTPQIDCEENVARYDSLAVIFSFAVVNEGIEKARELFHQFRKEFPEEFGNTFDLLRCLSFVKVESDESV